LEHDIWKYILSCLAHKNNKDVTAKPTAQPPSHTREVARQRKENALMDGREVAKAKRSEGDNGVQDMMKKVRMEGMHSVISKNRVDAIVSGKQYYAKD
jgi:hypothetical protein